MTGMTIVEEAGDARPSLRRRLSSVAAAAAETAVPDSVDSATDSAEDSGASTSSESEARDGAGDGEGREAKGGPVAADGQDLRNEQGRGGGLPPATFLSRASFPAHRKVKESPLSSDSIFKQSHAGLFNLCIVVLIAVNSRLIIENLMKYGLLIRGEFWFSSTSLRDWPLLICCLTLPVFSFGAFLIEKMAHRALISDSIVIALYFMLTTAEILYPVYVIFRCGSAVLFGIALMLLASIVWLKLISYAHTNYDLRTIYNSMKKGDVSPDFSSCDYAEGICLKNLVYFMVAPTLCYQTTYPRTECIRKGWVIRQVVKLVIFTGVMGFIIEQYINPIIKNSQHPLKENFVDAVERVLKLSVPTLYVWLCMFYCFFHLWLNILAELLCFGDREFYKDWWNAKTIDEYWRMWNMPVHKWMVRHIYFPCLRNGISKEAALIVAFVLSALYHESLATYSSSGRS